MKNQIKSINVRRLIITTVIAALVANTAFLAWTVAVQNHYVDVIRANQAGIPTAVEEVPFSF